MSDPVKGAPEALTVDLATLRRRHVDHHAIDCDLPVAWLARVLSSTDAEVDRPGHVALALHLQPRGVVVATGQLDVGFDVPCGRCLSPAAVKEAAARIVATFVPASSARGPASAARGPASASRQPEDEDGEDGLGLREGDLDTWTYEGVTLDLSPMVAEQVKLAYPMRVLCSRGDACRGLCSNCGADLNAQAGLVCEACGSAVPKTPVANSQVDPPGAAGANGDPEGAQPGGAVESPLAAALKKLMS